MDCMEEQADQRMDAIIFLVSIFCISGISNLWLKTLRYHFKNVVLLYSGKNYNKILVHVYSKILLCLSTQHYRSCDHCVTIYLADANAECNGLVIFVIQWLDGGTVLCPMSQV